MKGHWTDSSYVGIMPDGSEGWFDTWGEYIAAYEEAQESSAAETS
jgi:hypothetical protein